MKGQLKLLESILVAADLCMYSVSCLNFLTLRMKLQRNCMMFGAFLSPVTNVAAVQLVDYLLGGCQYDSLYTENYLRYVAKVLERMVMGND